MTALFEELRAGWIQHVRSPKLEAYKYMFWLQRQARRTSLTVESGRYTVGSDGLQTIVFVTDG